jgi:cardiolipin synthase
MGLSFIPNLLELSWELNWWTFVWWGGALVALFHIPSVLMCRQTRPMAALAWILCLLTLPFVGVILWWGIGRTRLERRKRRWARSRETMTQHLSDVRQAMEMSEAEQAAVEKEEREEEARVQLISNDALYIRQDQGVFPPTKGNHVEIYSAGHDAYDAFEEAVRSATDHIHFQFYIWQRDEIGRRFRDVLTEKAKEGVEVRVLYDAVGGAPVKRGFMDPLIEAGGKVASFLPVVLFERQLRINFRNHRKIIVIDGKAGFIGGMNIGEEYVGWLDLAFRLDGPVVLQLQEVFAEDWYFATGEDLASQRYFLSQNELGQTQTGAKEDGHQGTDQQATDQQAGGDVMATSVENDGGQEQQEALTEGSNGASPAQPDARVARTADSVTARIIASGPDNPNSVIENVFFLAITSASERIFITTPYFVPDQAILMAIKTAAIRGIDVRLLTPGNCDIPIAQAAGRSYYAELLEAGVRIFEYSDERVLHAKAVVVDDHWSIIGSANMDIRSFLLNFEVNAVLHDRGLNEQMSRLFEEHMAKSEEMSLDAYQKRPLKNRLIESTARLFSPLL